MPHQSNSTALWCAAEKRDPDITLLQRLNVFHARSPCPFASYALLIGSEPGKLSVAACINLNLISEAYHNTRLHARAKVSKSKFSQNHIDEVLLAHVRHFRAMESASSSTISRSPPNFW
jgi:hypothetical protein